MIIRKVHVSEIFYEPITKMFHMRIPPTRCVTSYGEISSALGRPWTPRLVGQVGKMLIRGRVVR